MLTALLVVLGTSLAWLSRSTRQAATADQPRRSIVVLPFQSLSEATKGDYFADGLTDDLTTSLAMHPELFIIARDSAFVYKGQTVADADLVAKLKVRYVLRGSVRQDGSNVRINARLIDTETGGHEWAEQFEGDSAHLLDLEHVITQRIITALLQRIVPAGHERELVWRTTNPQAYDAFLAGRQHFYTYLNKQENEKARALFEQALHHDPKFAMAHAMLAWTYAFDAMNGWSANRAASLATALKIGQQAVALNKNMPLAHFVTGLAYREQTEYVKALAEAEKAIALDPNYANGQVLVATLLYYAGRPEDSIAPLKKAIRLNPHHPFHYLFHLGQAYYVLHRYEDAIKAFRDGISRNPSAERLRVWLAAALAQAGKIEDAQWEANEVRALNPNFNLAAIAEAFPFKYKVDADHLMDGLRKAGFS